MKAFVILLVLMLSPTLLAETETSVQIGGRQWQLRMIGDQPELLQELKQTAMLSWCFEALKGRGILKDFTLHIQLTDSHPEVSISKSELKVSDEDRRVLSCLDNTLKEFPPRSLQTKTAAEVRFEYTVKRGR